MITVREIADDKTTISSTRWAFAAVVKTDIVIVVVSLLAGLIGHFIGKPISDTFYGQVALLLGILTGIVTTSKALQGFEPHSKGDNEVKKESEDSSEK